MSWRIMSGSDTQTEWCSTWSNTRKGSLRRRGTESGRSRSRCPQTTFRDRSLKGWTSHLDSGGRSSGSNRNTNQQIDSWWLELLFVKFCVLPERDTFIHSALFLSERSSHSEPYQDLIADLPRDPRVGVTGRTGRAGLGGRSSQCWEWGLWATSPSLDSLMMIRVGSVRLVCGANIQTLVFI